MQPTLLLTLALSLFAMSSTAQIYKTTDENGRIIYTDTPTDKAEQVKLKTTNTAPAVALPDQPEQPADNAVESRPYRLHITSPAPGTTLTPGEQSITISFLANQPLQPGLRFQLLDNGNPVGRSTTGNSVTLTEVERGEHNLSVIIYDPDDRILAESAPLPLYVHRPIAPQKSPRNN